MLIQVRNIPKGENATLLCFCLLSERTEKLPMGSIKNVVSEPIEGHEEYHIMVSVNIENTFKQTPLGTDHLKSDGGGDFLYLLEFFFFGEFLLHEFFLQRKGLLEFFFHGMSLG